MKMPSIPFLAKSSGETIDQHIEDLLAQLNILKQTYPEILPAEQWELLALACEYHDLGKINPKFQQKLHQNISMMINEVPHGLLSANLIDTQTLRNIYSKTDVQALTHAVALHHDRFLDQDQRDAYINGIQELTSPAEQLTKLPMPIRNDFARPISQKYYALGKYPNPEDKYYLEYIILKGLLNRLDYAASGHYNVEYPKTTLNKNVLRALRAKLNNPNLTYNTLQNYTLAHQNDNLVIIAQTGMGKTESALNWLNNNKSFFILPLRSATNAIYQRLSNNYQLDSKHLTLLSSDTNSLLADTIDNRKDYYQEKNETKNYSKQLTIATLDQIFSFVYHYKGFEEQLATLKYSKLVIDEIQMYQPNLLAYIIFGLKQIQDLGGHFQIMTATLSPFVTDQLKKAGLNFVKPAPFINQKLNYRHSVKVVHDQLTTDDILRHYHNNKMLVIVNTVKRAQELYQQLQKTDTNLDHQNIHLIHSRYTNQDRKRLEADIQNFTKKDNHETGIWIGTQVVEASLDLDFDILLTELSELNGLFQRMGRCYRQRNFKQTPQNHYNIYIYDGGNSSTSGINNSKHSVIDFQLFTVSKHAIQNLDRYLTEQAKLDLIDKTYTSDNLNISSSPDKLSYQQEFNVFMQYLNDLQTSHMSKSDMRQKFRNINNTNAIPSSVYEINKNVIDNTINVLLDPKSDVIDKVKARNLISQFEINVPDWMLLHGDRWNQNFIKNDKLDQCGYKILSDRFDYDSQIGLQ